MKIIRSSLLIFVFIYALTVTLIFKLYAGTVNDNIYPLQVWKEKNYGENVSMKDFPFSLCQKNSSTGFSMNYKKSIVPAKYQETFNQAMYYMNWIIYNTDFLDMVKLQNFTGITGDQVASRIKYSNLMLNFSFRSFGALGKSYVCSNNQNIILHRSRLSVGPWGLARTVFHESMHVIGLGHNHGFVPIIGPLMQKYYDQYKSQMDLEYANMTK